MEPYRAAGFRCPTCTSQPPLREFQSRLVCDECQGLYIDENDFVASCADLANLDIELHVGDGTPTKEPHACPRCDVPLQAAKIDLKPVKVSADVLRCPTDGLWFKSGQLTGMFAVISRRTGHKGGAYYGRSGGPLGLDGLPAGRHGPSKGILAISDWSSRPRRRTPTASPINLYRDQPMPCPACATPLAFFGDRYACPQCAGTFVQNDALVSMVMDVSKALWDIPLPTGQPGTRACPVCTNAMLVEDLEKVPVDRCATHGVWFDQNELTVALERASGQFDPRGVRAWLKKLFT